jgi:hypothetical protein
MKEYGRKRGTSRPRQTQVSRLFHLYLVLQIEIYDFIITRVSKLCTHGEKIGDFRTDRSIFAWGGAVMSSENAFLASRLTVFKRTDYNFGSYFHDTLLTSYI